jgi:hypothetical protein
VRDDENRREGGVGRRSRGIRVPLKQGELAPEDTVEGSEASAGRRNRGKHAEYIETHPHVHGTRTDSHGDPLGRRICWLRNRML